MNAVYFIQQFIREPRTVGAVAPSSKYLAKQMIAPIDFASAKCIIEYGPGTGIFTEQLIQHKKKETVLFLLETNDRFYMALQEKYGHLPNVHIIHDSAECAGYHMRKYDMKQADYVVSGLPFTSLPRDVAKRILSKTAELLGENGEFITFQYSKVKQRFFQSFFPKIEKKRVLFNLPPAYVFTCRK
ncbi:class I SAM-dependent methyltransferase [Ectobacillus panaciterrae]|uniref:class I SAM-dependent methyltransferase n=1 Tax=Ectobacillus panaciterrae TaxID=363872 RepID=UPI000419B075|nr:rRNA adenine N-6-methyltransferase family protein [Ectobacillus panaciterrae]